MFLSIRNVCVSPGATLLFHAGGTRQTASAPVARSKCSAPITPFCSGMSPPTHFMDTLDFHPISGSEIIKRFGYMSVARVIDQLSAELAARGHAAASARAITSLASIVERESTVLAYIDGFWLTFWFAVFGIVFVSLIGTPPSVRFVPVPFSEWLGLRLSRLGSSLSQK